MKYTSILLLLLALTGCKFFDGNKSAKHKVAEVGDKVLYEEDFLDIFNASQTPDDSIKLRENYINKWIRDEVLFQNALNNLTDSLKNKEEQLDLYYRSLIRYEYEKALINQKLDTSVGDKEILDYYNQFTESFILKRKVCKAAFLVLTNDIPNKEQAIDWLAQSTTENTDSLQKYCLRYGVKFNLNDKKWFYLDDLMAETTLPAAFELTNQNNPVIYNDSIKLVALRVEDLKTPGDPKPFQMTSQTIRDIIKNKKKVDFLRKMENDVYLKSERKAEFEIYE
ncbi:MAG: hypothetical protein ACPGLV_02915 [Bacteroidia bacterium]